MDVLLKAGDGSCHQATREHAARRTSLLVKGRALWLQQAGEVSMEGGRKWGRSRREEGGGWTLEGG